MKTDFDITYFLMKFADIPEEEWACGDYENRNGQRCALGHCGVRLVRDGMGLALAQTVEGFALLRLAPDIYAINDGKYREYDHVAYGDHPKERVINYLKAVRDGNA